MPNGKDSMSDAIDQCKQLIATTVADIQYLADNLREADRLEMHHLGYEPEAGLMQSFSLSEVCYSVYLGDELVCVFGVCPGEGLAVPWMMGTPAMSKVKRETLTWAVEVKAALSEKYPVLSNYVWAGNTTHIRWIKWLGFAFTGEQFERSGETFIQFISRK